MLHQITLMDRSELAPLEKLFGLPQVKDVAPLGLPQQYVTSQQNLPNNVLYVPGDWRCRFKSTLCKRSG